ncbi:Ferredoxin-NADP reductase [Marinitoga hydrogenitolerans DSM 16785]|uniref:Ferredoxin-NADP reductase n=1 Tax=Marinitoga hydrogenitolerans (strain DSM 16785 / JCM 12826 / AT1271) TaxID=1122195 RepID=A0A1M4ZC39_MARH1|nr:FAD-dependent oxidoreductase [Marinitoga hydrogenitolerans]SHF15535.1 Ferredoxin-NADP reductase [Marinitoga hydrogenitolerans DSM 16785]
MIITSKCIITDVIEISETLKLFEFEIDKYMPWEPGMFLHLNLDSSKFNPDWSNSRPFSFASYGDKKAKILVRKLGYYTNRMFDEMKIGKEFYIRYPFGDFFLNDNRNKVLIAAGSGISPFMSYMDYIIKENIKSQNYLFHSVKIEKESIDNYYSVPKNVILKKFVTRENTKNIPNRHIEKKDISNLENRNTFDYYICGSELFIDKYRNILEENNIKNIFYDYWS